MNGSTPEEYPEQVRATAEDANVQAILRASRERVPVPPLSTEESIRAGAEYMREGQRNAMKTLLGRIERNELIPQEVFSELLNVSNEWISDALSDNRLFSFDGPHGKPFFPAFYCDRTIARDTLELISKTLGTLPSASKYHFFTSKSTFLQTKTPLMALKEGLLAKVVAAAQGFAER